MLRINSLLNRYYRNIVETPDDLKNKQAKEIAKKYEIEMGSIYKSFLKAEENITEGSILYDLSPDDMRKAAIIYYELSSRNEFGIITTSDKIPADTKVTKYNGNNFVYVKMKGKSSNYRDAATYLEEEANKQDSSGID